MVTIAIIGAGAFAQTHLRVWAEQPAVEIGWVCDPNEEALSKVAADFTVGRTSTDYRQALADPSVDAVDIVAPNFLHVEIAVAAAEAGKHILCEKPLALNAVQTQQMVDAAAAAGVILFPKYHQRFEPIHRELARIGRGSDGPAYKIGVAHRLSNHLGTMLDRNHWRGNPALTGGGLLFSSGSHTLDVLCSVFGPAAAVTAVNRQLIADDPDKADDNATVVIEHAGGAMSSFTGCWTVRSRPGTVVAIHAPDESYRAQTDGDDLVLLRDRPGGTDELVRTPDWFYESNRLALQNFAEVVQGTAEPLYALDEILHSIKVLEAAYESSDAGRRIALA